jgi:hypothetical protein
MAKKKENDQDPEWAGTGNAGENAAQLDEGQGGSHDLNHDVAEQQEAGNAGGNAGAPPDESEPKGEEKQGGKSA